MNTGTIVLTFSKLIDVSSSDLTLLTLQDSNSGAVNSFTLVISSTYCGRASPITVTISLSGMELDAIKYKLTLCIDSTCSFISIPNTFARDVAMNRINAIQTSNALQVTSALYTPDVTRPSIVSFDLDMSTLKLMMTFSEQVRLQPTRRIDTNNISRTLHILVSHTIGT